MMLLDKIKAVRFRVEFLSFVFTGIALLGIYSFTLAPSINLEWGGVLITAADRLGVAITPGQPLWTMLGFLFCRLFGWASFCGSPNPARGVNWLSAVCGALSGSLVAWWVCRLARLKAERSGEPLSVGISVWCGFAAGTMTGLGTSLWSQSVVAETFSLHLALTLFALLLLDSWIRERSVNALYGAFLIFGLTVTAMYEGFVLSPLLLYAVIVQRPKLRHILPLLVLLAAGFLPWLYLPLASAQHPPVNWGYACSWEGFLHIINRGQFERVVFSDVFRNPVFAFQQLVFGLRLAASQYSLPVLLVAVPGFICAFRFSRRSGGLLTFAILLYTAGVIWGLNPRMDAVSEGVTARYLIPAFSLIAIATGVAVYSATSFLCQKLHRYGRLATSLLLLLLPLTALYMSLFAPRNLSKYGSPSQRGNTFGWQFGAGILNGQRGLLPVMPEGTVFPDADYPPPLAPNSVLFGGTDPGRFVPTYMVFCAGVRPDVSVITQNALADAAYMRELRDLYGNRLWIPAQEDMNQAFRQYIQTVKAGGRIQVQDVGGVMEINGILARMIFDRNKGTHEFYVEESYVIPWMYPYLTPHGLIMRLNSEPSDLSPETVKKDRDFWNWYVARLMSDQKFLRDVNARKTFSKLRSTIAGLYAARFNLNEAEYAFRQAVQLCPSSPEACFRLADLYVRQRRFDDAGTVINDFLALDRQNGSAKEFLDQIEQARRESLPIIDAK